MDPLESKYTNHNSQLVPKASLTLFFQKKTHKPAPQKKHVVKPGGGGPIMGFVSNSSKKNPNCHLPLPTWATNCCNLDKETTNSRHRSCTPEVLPPEVRRWGSEATQHIQQTSTRNTHTRNRLKVCWFFIFFGEKQKQWMSESLKIIDGEKQILTKDLKTGRLQPSSQLGLGLSNNKNLAPQSGESPKIWCFLNWATNKKSFPLYWMVNRDPYNGSL